MELQKLKLKTKTFESNLCKHFLIRLLLIACMVLFTGLPGQLRGQSPEKDSLSESILPQDSTNTRLLGGGIQVGLANITGFGELMLGNHWKVGASIHYGANITNLMLASGEFFAKEKSINLAEQGGESSFYYEFRGYSFYINIDAAKKLDLLLGYRYSRTYSSHPEASFRDGVGLKGHFKGFFVQPSFGKGWFQYSCRLAIGKLHADELIYNEQVEPEFSIIFQPLIIRMVIP